MLKFRMIVLGAALLAAATALPMSHADAASSSKKSPSADQADPYKAGQDLVKDGKFDDALGQFEKAARLDPTNADAFNMLAYTQRRLGQLDAAFENYEKALALDPEHKGAHEYVGEAYLLTGDLAKAEEHLNKLKTLCPGGCDESRMLLKSVERYKSSDKNAALDTLSW